MRQMSTFYVPNYMTEVQVMLTPLHSESVMTATEFGAKASSLATMKRMGIPVPEGAVLGRSYLERLLQHNDKLMVFQTMVSSETALNRFRKLNQLIMGLKFPREDRERISEYVTSLGGCVAVRSSGPDEDGASSSMAGLYSSFTDLNGEQEVLRAILRCFASAFTQGVYMHGQAFGQGTAVIIQRYVAFDIGGVAFSCDPVTGDPSRAVINFVKGGVEQLVSGDRTGTYLSVPKGGPFPREGALGAEALQNLSALACRLEELFDGPVDLEWGIRDGNLYCVQARPVSSLPKHSPGITVIDVDDLQTCERADLGPLRKRHLRWLDKKFHVRRLCRHLGVRIPAMRYVLLPPDEGGALSALREALSSMHAAFIEVFDGDTNTIVEPDRLTGFCQERSAGFSNPLKLRVQEFQDTIACGYASVASDGSIYVETLPGGFAGFWEDGLTPSVYLLAEDGTVRDERISTVPEFRRFDRMTLQFGTYRPAEPVAHSLPPEVLREIAALGRKISAELGEVRLEWVYDGYLVQLFDLSEESRPLVEAVNLSHIVSAGYAEGPVCIMEDIDVLDPLFNDSVRDIDVVPKQAFLDVLESEAFKSMATDVLCHMDKPVVVAEFQKRTLAVLADHVAGFIFERGALLCHLAIILREKGVPAIVVPDARKHLRQGERVRLVEGRLIRDGR